MALPDDILKEFPPLTLEAMDTVRLMNRQDTKFVFASDRLPAILGALTEDYRILEICGGRSCHYETLYFDTPDHRLYLQHHNGRSNRVKVRCRRYVDSDISYFEIKKKNNKARTIKERIKSKGICGEISGKAADLLTRETHLDPGSLAPSLWVYFTRITLVNLAMTERLTIDTGLTFKNGAGEKSCSGLVIAELKQDRSSASQFRSVMIRNHIRPYKMSKYCLGIMITNPGIRKNNFKEKLIHLNKIDHDVN